MGLNLNRCTRCLMPGTKPGLTIHEDGECDACHHDKVKQDLDYGVRFKELWDLCNKYREKDGSYDCIIPISGGKDSTYVTYRLKEIMNMNPLLVMVKDSYSKTRSGLHNLEQMRDVTECDVISLDLNPSVEKQMSRLAFENLGSPTWPIDKCIYTFPLRVAIEKNIPLVVFGEDTTWEYGGMNQEETPSALKQINNDAVKPVPDNFWEMNGISSNYLNQFKYPTAEEIESVDLNPVYMSYFIPWDGYHNYYISQQLGFRELGDAWDRKGYVDDYDQTDSVGYLMNVWMKYPKYGFHRTTDMVGNWIRSGFMNTKKASKLIDENDHLLDPYVLSDFLRYAEYTEEEFWAIVGKFWNREIFDDATISEVVKANQLPVDLPPLHEIVPPFKQQTYTCDYSCKQIVEGK